MEKRMNPGEVCNRALSRNRDGGFNALTADRPSGLTRVSAVLTLLLCGTAFAQNATDVQRCEDSGLYRHIRMIEPGRSNRPLRQDNISDEEVREVQRAALEVYPDFIVSISGVTEGCDCEDGSHCTAQVWLALNRENQTRSLVLSKTDGHWKIGAVQSWWLQYNAHQTSFPGIGRDAKQRAWQTENQRLLDAFPACPTAPAHWTLMRSESDRWTCVDMSSLEISESIRRVNVKVVYAPPKRTSSIPWIRYDIDLNAFDCTGHRTRTDEMTLYFSDGTAQQTAVDNPVLWYPIRPNTTSAADLDLVCGWRSK
jgi:Surface-adhesin protein E